MYTSNYSFHPDRVMFSETDEKKTTASWFILEKISDNKTRLTLELYLRKDLLSPILFRLTKKKKVEAAYLRSLDNLEVFIRDASGKLRMN